MAVTTSLGNVAQNNALVTVSNLLGNSNCNIITTNGNYFVAESNVTPANSIALPAVVQGQFWFDGTYLYFADANGHTKRNGPFTSF